MAERRTIAVVGATGAQGGGLVRAILADPMGGFAVRALTRDPDAEPARALARLGAEVVRADVSDPASVARAFAGAHGAFCVTFFWAHMSPEREMAEAKGLAEAAREAGVRHVIWSTLEDTRLEIPLSDPRMPTLQGKYKVPHFDAKGESDRFFADLPTTYLLTSFYWENFIHFGMGPRPGPDGTLVLSLPMANAPLAGIAAEDIGRCAYGIFRRGGEFAGKRVGIAGEHLTGTQMAAGMAAAFGRPVRYEAMPFEVYRGLGFPGADDLGNMFQYDVECGPAVLARRDVAFSRSLNPALQGFAQWLAANASRIPLG